MIDRCMKCGKHVDELKPFGKEGDPLNGNFEGLKLVRRYRTMLEETIEKYEQILSEYKHDPETGTDNISELELKYGEENIDSAFLYDQLSNTIESSYECRDCIIT